MEDYFRQLLTRDGAVLIDLATADARERAAGRSVEPDVPTGAARYLSEPMFADGGPVTFVSDD